MTQEEKGSGLIEFDRSSPITSDYAALICRLVVCKMELRGVQRGSVVKLKYLKVVHPPSSTTGYLECESSNKSNLSRLREEVDSCGRLLIDEFAGQWHGV